MSGLSGVVLAGGHSVRLGVDKRTARLGGATLLERAAALLADLADDLMVAAQDLRDMGGAAADRGGIRMGGSLKGRGEIRAVPDALRDHGPLAGILAGLQHARYARVLVIPVDMPMLTPAFLQFLVAIDPGAAVTVPSWQAGLEPLVAVYQTACVPALVEFLAHGGTAVHAFINSTALPVHRVEERDIRRHGDPARLFFNINTPEDLSRAEAMLPGPRPPDAPRSP